MISDDKHNLSIHQSLSIVTNIPRNLYLRTFIFIALDLPFLTGRSRKKFTKKWGFIYINFKKMHQKSKYDAKLIIPTFRSLKAIILLWRSNWKTENIKQTVSLGKWGPRDRVIRSRSPELQCHWDNVLFNLASRVNSAKSLDYLCINYDPVSEGKNRLKNKHFFDSRCDLEPPIKTCD